MPVGGHISLMLSFLIALYCLEKTYSALAVGLVRVSELVYSQSLANLICDAFFYIAVSLYSHSFLGVFPMLAVLLAQMILSLGWSAMANRIYYSNYPLPYTAIVYGTEEDLLRVQSIRDFSSDAERQGVFYSEVQKYECQRGKGRSCTACE